MLRLRVALALLAACSSSSSTSSPPAPSSPPSSSEEPAKPPFGADPDEPSDAATAAVLDMFPHVLVLKLGEMGEYRDIVKTARELDPDVVAAEAFGFVSVQLQAADRTLDVDIEGVGPARNRVRMDKERYVTAGVLPLAGTGAEVPLALGDGLAHQLGVRVGDTLTLRPIVHASWMPIDAAPLTYIARVAGLVHTGVPDLDAKLAYTTFAAAQTINNRGDLALGVALKLAHVKKAPAIAKRLAERLGGSPYEVEDWCQLNKAFLRC